MEAKEKRRAGKIVQYMWKWSSGSGERSQADQTEK
jgi:hypothetical protein